MLIVIPDTLTIARRYCGPPTTGNGGYSAGLLGRYIDGPAQVTLRSPPPLERPLRLARENDKLLLRDGEQLVAEAVPTDFELDVPAAPSFEQAEAAVQRYVGFTERTFPTCFVCGPDREAGDGLRIFPGETGAGVVAAPWIPDASLAAADGVVQPEYVWAALDCPGAFAGERRPPGKAILLGRFEVELTAPVRVGERCVVIGWPLGKDGRKIHSGTAVFGADGRLCGKARAIWIEVDFPQG